MKVENKENNKKAKRKELINLTKEANLGEVVFKYPEIAEVLIDYGLHCVGCAISGFDTIEQGAKIHGMTDDEVQEMIDRINEVINFGE